MILSTKLTPQEIDSYFDKSMEALGLHSGMVTKPDMLRDILDHEMYLADFLPAQKLMKPLIAHSVSFDPMFDAIRQGIQNRHPAIRDFLVTALNNNLFNAVAGLAAVIEKTIHRMYLLELLAQEMAASPDFLVQLHIHYLNKRHELGVDESLIKSIKSLYHSTHNIFETAKILTVDNTIAQYLLLRTKSQIVDDDLNKKNKALIINLFEAILSDYVSGNKDNSLTGVSLSMSLAQNISVEGNNKLVIQHFNDGWTELYETWNLAFVIGNVGNPEMMLPKLLIPSVINAEPGYYLFMRGITLWLSANVLLFYRLNGDHRSPKVADAMVTIAKHWGAINLLYAEKFSQNSCGHEIKVNSYFKKLLNTIL